MQGRGRSDYYVTAEEDGWYRLSFFNKTVTQYQLQINVATLLNGTSVAGDGVKGVVIDDFQIENGDVLTPYQFTTTARNITQSGIADQRHVPHENVGGFLQRSGEDEAKSKQIVHAFAFQSPVRVPVHRHGDVAERVHLFVVPFQKRH